MAYKRFEMTKSSLAVARSRPKIGENESIYIYTRTHRLYLLASWKSTPTRTLNSRIRSRHRIASHRVVRVDYVAVVSRVAIGRAKSSRAEPSQPDRTGPDRTRSIESLNSYSYFYMMWCTVNRGMVRVRVYVRVRICTCIHI